MPVYVTAPNSHYALCIDYSRLQLTHPTIGYFKTRPMEPLSNVTAGDGIYNMNLKPGNLLVCALLEGATLGALVLCYLDGCTSRTLDKSIINYGSENSKAIG